MSLLRTCLLVVCSVLLLDAAVGREQALKDAQVVWEQQAAQVVAGDGAAPWITGAHVWRGRADEDYKPFHQWELRVQTGSQAADGWRLRVVPLDSHFKAQTVVKPHWMDVPATAAGESVTLSYKLNCSAIAAYRIEIEADDDQSFAFLAGSQRELPQLELPGKKGAQLLASDVDFKYSKKQHKALVTFYLANVGDSPAEEVQVTIRFLDEQKNEVFSSDYVPGSKKSPGLIEPGYGESQEVLVKKVPDFYTVSLSMSKKEELVFEDGGGDAAAANEVALSNLRVADGVLSATVVNGTDTAVNQLAIQIDLQDANGATVKSVELKTPSLAAGASTELKTEVGEVSFSGYSMGFSYQ